VVVGWAENAEGQERAFRWTAAGGMEDLNITYAHLLTDGSVLVEARAISPDGRYIVGWGYNAATGRREAFLLDTQGTWR
jgi:probable HAF family extracellular repeat protein